MPTLHFLGLLLVEFGMIGIVIVFSIPALMIDNNSYNKYWLAYWLAFSSLAVFTGYAIAFPIVNSVSRLISPNIIFLIFGIITFAVSAFQARDSSNKKSCHLMLWWLALMCVGLFFSACYFAPHLN